MTPATSKILAFHLDRAACVYLRQSTIAQVRENPESTARQYALADHARSLGWSADQVRVLDADLGKSGKSAEGRDDFHQLCAAVGLGEVGAVFALEASRLSRSQADWHRLLDLCAWTRTLLIDHDGIYDPNEFNDRVLLGFKGTFSHTELHAMRMRLQGARRNKAHRGALRSRPPIGYVYEEGGGLVLDPDEGVVVAVRAVFSQFRALGSAYAVGRQLAAQGVRFPKRSWPGGTGLGLLTWAPLRKGRVTQILASPVYAGTYVHGRRTLRPIVRDGKLVGTRLVALPRAQWEADLPGAHVGYITPQAHEENQRLLTMNRTGLETGARQGRPRNGRALLQGLTICGRCGRRMQVGYPGKMGGAPIYVCVRGDLDVSADGATRCWSTPGARIDAAVEQHVLAQMTGDNLNLSLAVLEQIEQDAAEGDQQGRLRLERARQDVARAERQYQLAEPENRLVVRTLERRWEEKLAELTALEARQAADRSRPQLTLSAEERTRILQLAQDLPALWGASTTRHEDRKELLGLLVQQIALVPEELPSRQTRVRMLWHGGKVTELVLHRPSPYTVARTSEATLEVIRELMPRHTDREIAEILTTRGLRTGRGKPWTTVAVVTARHGHDLPRRGKDAHAASRLGPRLDGRYSTRAVATLVGVDRTTVHYWRKTGVIVGTRDGEDGRTWWFDLPTELTETLRERVRLDRRRMPLPSGAEREAL